MSEYSSQSVASQSYYTLDDIVFENRNKEYGAYDLRKRYRRFVIVAFFLSFSVIGLAVISPLINAYYNKNKKIVKVEKNTKAELMDMKSEEDAPPPPPPPPPPPAAIQAQVAFVAPKVVDSVKEEVEMKSAEEIVQNNVTDAPPTDLNTQVVETKTEEVVAEEPVFVAVEEEATFQGGDLNTFRNWIANNLVYPQQAAENNSQGRVFVQFCVNSKGAVVDVKVLRSSGDESLDAEAIRVIRVSPKWIPAKQGGNNCKQQFTLPVNFTLAK